MITRNTKQKEIVLDILKHHRTHPTIQEIYKFAKEKDPSIGQATIYRNVNKLVEEGKVIKLPNSSNESFHYDINIEPHTHMLCKRCGRIVDIYDNDYNELINTISNNNSLIVEKAVILLEGICSSCNK